MNCHIIATGMHFFGLNSMEDQPRCNSFPIPQSCELQWKALSATIGHLVNRYIVIQLFQELQPRQTISIPVATDFFYNPHAVRVRTDTHIVTLSQCKLPLNTVMQNKLTIFKTPKATTASVYKYRCSSCCYVCENVPDGVFNYACSVLNDGLLLLEYRDVIHERDGPKILQCWKFGEPCLLGTNVVMLLGLMTPSPGVEPQGQGGTGGEGQPAVVQLVQGVRIPAGCADTQIRGTRPAGKTFLFEPDPEVMEKTGLQLEDTVVNPDEAGKVKILVRNPGKVANELQSADLVQFKRVRRVVRVVLIV